MDEKDEERECYDHSNEEAQYSQRSDSRRLGERNLVRKRRRKPKVVKVAHSNISAEKEETS